jgi:hypothetical protein
MKRGQERLQIADSRFRRVPSEEGARGIVDGKFKIQDWARAHPR